MESLLLTSYHLHILISDNKSQTTVCNISIPYLSVLRCLMVQVTLISIQQTNKTENTETTISFEPPISFGEFIRNICVNCGITPYYSEFIIINAILLLTSNKTNKLYHFNFDQILISLPNKLTLIYASSAEHCVTLRNKFSLLPNFSLEELDKIFSE